MLNRQIIYTYIQCIQSCIRSHTIIDNFNIIFGRVKFWCVYFWPNYPKIRYQLAVLQDKCKGNFSGMVSIEQRQISILIIFFIIFQTYKTNSILIQYQFKNSFFLEEYECLNSFIALTLSDWCACYFTFSFQETLHTLLCMET